MRGDRSECEWVSTRSASGAPLSLSPAACRTASELRRLPQQPQDVGPRRQKSTSNAWTKSTRSPRLPLTLTTKPGGPASRHLHQISATTRILAAMGRQKGDCALRSQKRSAPERRGLSFYVSPGTRADCYRAQLIGCRRCQVSGRSLPCACWSPGPGQRLLAYSVYQKLLDISQKPDFFFECRRPCTPQHLLQHTSTSTQHNTTQHHTTQHSIAHHHAPHNTHSAPATLCNMSETQHHD